MTCISHAKLPVAFMPDRNIQRNINKLRILSAELRHVPRSTMPALACFRHRRENPRAFAVSWRRDFQTVPVPSSSFTHLPVRPHDGFAACGIAN